LYLLYNRYKGAEKQKKEILFNYFFFLEIINGHMLLNNINKIINLEKIILILRRNTNIQIL